MTLPSPIRPSDPQTFTYLYNRFFEEVYAYARKAGEADGFDYVHDAFTYLYSHDKEFPDEQKVRNFIITCVRHSAINKHQHRIEEVTDEYELIQDDPVIVEGAFMAKVLAMFDRLPKKSKEVIELRFLKGLKVKEIAALLGITEFTVRTQINRGINKMRVWDGTYKIPAKQQKRKEAIKEAREIIKQIGKEEFIKITGDKDFIKYLYPKASSTLDTSRILENIERYKLKTQS